MTHTLRTTGLPLVLAGLGLVLSSCATPGNVDLLGYTTAPQYPAHIRTVRVPIFKNETFVRGIEFELSEAIIKRIEATTPWKVVQHGNADAELTGKVVNLSKRVIIQNQLNEIREADLRLGVEVLWRDCHAGPPVPDPLPPLAESPPLDAEGPAPLRPAQLFQGKPVIFVQKSTQFVPELGESLATARARVVEELATQVVSMLEVPW
jgi:hypothetical protein